MPAGPKNALARWGRSALRPVVLPSGMKALVRLPDPGDLIRNEAFPQELRKMAGKFAVGGIEIAALKPDEVRTFLAMTYELVARSVKYLAPPESEAWDRFLTEGTEPAEEGWEVVSLPAEFFSNEEAEVDPADVEALAQIVGRQATPNEITVRSKFDLGLIGAAAMMAQKAAEEPGGRVSDFAGFRGEPGRDLDRADGEDVRDPAVRASSGERPGRRIGGRRSGRA